MPRDAIVVSIVKMAFAILLFRTVTASELGAADPNDLATFISSVSDTALKETIDSAKESYDQAALSYAEAKNRLETTMKLAKQGQTESVKSQLEQAIADNNREARLLTSAEVRLRQLQREWDRRSGMPQDVKEYESLLAYRNERYLKGAGTREDMIVRFKEFAAEYPDSPLAIRALYDAAMLYTGGRIRETGEEPYLPEKARELHAQIVAQHPDLLIDFVVWSRHELACLHPTADARFRGRLEFCQWLKSVGTKEYDATAEWMKRDYQFRNTPEAELKGRIHGLMQNTMESVRKNAASDANASSDPSENMRLLREVLADEPNGVGVSIGYPETGVENQTALVLGPDLAGKAESPGAPESLLGVSSVVCLWGAGAGALVVTSLLMIRMISRKSPRHGQ